MNVPFRAARRLVAIFLLISLLVFPSCGKKDDGSQSATANSSQSPQQTANSTANQTEFPSLNDEAIEIAKKDFAAHWSTYGDSLISRVKRPGFKEGNDWGEDFFIQRKNVSAEARPDQMTQADQLNGVEWKGSVLFVESAEREFFLRDRQPLLGAVEKSGWSDWKSPPDELMYGRGFWKLSLTKRNGNWSVSPQDVDESAFVTVQCDPNGKQPFDPQEEIKHRASSPGGIRIASITPAGTDLVIGIGAGDCLVAVSNFDDDREGTAGKPRIGDYQNINWEKLAGLGANVLLLQYAQDRVPPYIQQKCADLGIRTVNLKLDTIDEIAQGMMTLADVIGRPQQGRTAAAALRARLDAVRLRVAGQQRVRALVVTNDQSFALAGPGEFLDELLHIAGGQNAAESLGKPYPEVDREMIMSLAPDVVIRLVPDGDRKPQVVRQGDRIWESLPDLPAVKNRRVYVLSEWYGELPGFRVGELAEKFADILHPETAGPNANPALRK